MPTVRLKHANTDGSKIALFLYGEPRDEVFQDGSSVHAETAANPDDSNDSNGWICNPNAVATTPSTETI